MISYNPQPYSIFYIHLALNPVAKSPKLTDCLLFFPFICAESLGSNCCGNQSFFFAFENPQWTALIAYWYLRAMICCSPVLCMVFSFTIIAEEVASKQGKIKQGNKNVACNLSSQVFLCDLQLEAPFMCSAETTLLSMVMPIVQLEWATCPQVPVEESRAL